MDKLKRNRPQNLSLNINEDCFSTCDLGCSAALISAGYEIASLEKADPRKVQFIFYRQVDIEKAVNNYWVNTLQVKARSYFDNIKMLKNRIYSG